jgi:hypothetical protein
MTTYMALVESKESGEKYFVELDKPNIKAFKEDVYANGCRVVRNWVLTKGQYEWMMDNTNCEPWDYQEAKKMNL